MISRLIATAVIAAACGQAQAVRVYSEFQRIDPFGEIVPADRAERPREILSPALARNAFVSFHVVVELAEGKEQHLFVGQNPEDSIGVSVYAEQWQRRGETWIPDALVPLKLGENAQVPAVAPQVPGQKVMVYMLDLWARKDAPVRRTRVELQLSIGERWVIYPLELRFTQAVVPGANGAAAGSGLAAIEAPASESAELALREFLCSGAAGKSAAATDGSPTVRSIIRRNALQDVLLARSLEAKFGKMGMGTEVLDALGATDRKAWCEAPTHEAALGAEWYLRARDRIYKLGATPTLAELPQPTITVHPAK